MTHTKKRILSLLLAVVLMFGTLPFSVSADEITISDSSGDVPVLRAQDPFNTVKAEVEGGTNYMTSVGVTREAIVRELESHENDDFYLGTKYVGGDAQSPNGDTSYNSGTAGMNCAGFISYVLRKAGLDAETTMEIMHQTPVSQFGSGLPYDWLAGASNYKNLIENGNISAYAFRTKQELLSSGLAEKGDIILMWWSDTPGADNADNHIGFFWGKASDDDVMWHSGTEPSSGNQISAITPKTPGSFYILIKIEPLQPKEYTVTLTKTSADVSITQGNSAYSLAGATYNVYEGTSATGSVVATFTTDEAGHATLSTPLEDGTYSVKEVTPPKGYKLDEKIYTFTINGGDTTLSVEDEPGTLTLRLKKKDSQTGSTPQGNASLAGAVYQVTYQKGGQTVTQELTSDSSGNLGTLEGIPFGTISVKELSAPEGYRLDTEVHTYTVDGSQLTGDTYTLEVDDLTEEVHRGGLTIQKLDSETGTTPQGDASLEGISFEIVNQSQNPVVVNGFTASPGQVAMTITTNVAGVATTGENALPYLSGEYVINPLQPQNWDEDPVNEDDERTPEQRDAAPISRFPISESGKLAPAPETSVVPVPGPFQKTTMLSRHISYLKDFFRSYKDFTTAQLDTIELMLQKLYRRFGMDDYTDFSQVAADKFPTMSDFYDLLEEEYDLYDAKKKNLFSEETIQEVCLGLHSMCKGAESKYFNGHTNIKDDKFLVFGVKGIMELNRSLRDALLFSILSYMTNALLGAGNYVGALDELYLFLTNLTAIEYIRNLMKRDRKKDSLLVLSSQNIEDFLQPGVRELTKPLFSIPTHQFLFNPGQLEPKAFCDTLQLEPAEFELIRYPERGTCLYRCGNERYLLQVHFPEFKEAMFGSAGGR